MPMPESAMVMAAGFGTRLRPLTDRIPKPLVPVQNVPLIDVALDRLAEAGVKRAVVNLHHLGHLIRAHLVGRQRPEILFSEEPDILETGGGTKLALPLLGATPFFTVNAKIIWFDRDESAFHRLADFFDAARMDALVLLQPIDRAVGYSGAGDFHLAKGGEVRRRGAQEQASLVYAGISICHPRMFDLAPEGAFSLNLLWDRAIASGRLFGLVHDGSWFHVSSLDQLAQVETALLEQNIRLRV